jgi:frataxin-like iron-binding protein CyaY
LQVLKDNPLDRTFEAYGNFITPLTADNLKRKPELWGSTRFHGNFHALSHVFWIDTDEPELINTLTAAIRENQQRPDYKDQPIPVNPTRK